MARIFSRKNALLILGLLLVSASTALLAQQFPRTMMVRGSFVNVRKGPGTGYEQVATLYRGERVEAERRHQNWLRISLPDGRIGWVREDLVEPFDPNLQPMTDEEAESLQNQIETSGRQITTLEDSTTVLLAQARREEDFRDSMMNVLGLAAMPRADTLLVEEIEPEEIFLPRPLPGRQASVTSMRAEEPFPERQEFAPFMGVLLTDGKSLTAAGMNFSRNFTREFAWTAGVAFARRGPERAGALSGDFEHVFANVGLLYSYKPDRLAVPYLEIGAGAIRSEAADSSFTALDLTFGAGFRLYLTQDIALRVGYQGHGMMAEGNRLLHLVTAGGSIFVPPFSGHRPGWPHGEIYLSPYAAWQMYGRRFSMNATPVLGVLAGYRPMYHWAAELMAGWQPLKINDGLEQRSMSGAEFLGRLLYYPWGGHSGPFLAAGGGALFIGGEGRPPEGTSTYGAYLLGGGVSLECGEGISLRAELLNLVFPEVARIDRDAKVGAGNAFRAGFGLKFAF